MNEWINHPAMQNIDPIKLELIKAAAAQTSGKHGNNMATVMMALITSARKNGISFTPEEMSLILDVLKDGKSDAEKQHIDNMVNMVLNMIRNQKKTDA